jgi:cyclopropane fatty-acyl-phospholipid synthase-like methyltransferase
LQAKLRGLSNLQVITCDINSFTPPAEFNEQIDRVVAIEMFEVFSTGVLKLFDGIFTASEEL